MNSSLCFATVVEIVGLDQSGLFIVRGPPPSPPLTHTHITHVFMSWEEISAYSAMSLPMSPRLECRHTLKT